MSQASVFHVARLRAMGVSTAELTNPNSDLARQMSVQYQYPFAQGKDADSAVRISDSIDQALRTQPGQVAIPSKASTTQAQQARSRRRTTYSWSKPLARPPQVNRAG